MIEMEEIEKITNKKRFDIFNKLQKNQTLVKMRLIGKDYERLIIITGIRIYDNTSFIIIDYPRGFREAVTDIDIWKIYFEFKGEDELKYVFYSSGGKLSQNSIWIKFPEYIERHQRRKSFRLKVPPGTKIFFEIDSVKYKMEVIDISTGGALCVLTRLSKTDTIRRILKTGKELRDIELRFPGRKNEKRRVHIKKLVIIRSEPNPPSGRYYFAIQFTGIEKKQKKILTDMIYKMQRSFLRERLPL